jgi:predicted nucleotidyltransferase
MRVVGITAEYDPMHTGHIYHLGEARAVSTADFVVAVMSGDFTQRGEPALLDKWTRAKIAAENGIDLVLELPFAYACNSAEYFAYGAMEMMKRLGVVTHVAFGAESQNLQQLQEIAALLRAEIEMPEDGPCSSSDVLEAPEAAGKADDERVLGTVGLMGGHDAQGHGNS